MTPDLTAGAWMGYDDMSSLPTCKKKILEAFIKGTEPKEFCDAVH